MTGRLSKNASVADALALGAVVGLSALPYLPDLGFYSDDWGLLAGFAAEDKRGTLFGSVPWNFIERPVQGFYQALLFSLFGREPLGYHLVNTAVLAASVALLYLLLVRLKVGRALAFATALLFVMLPQLSTVRVWYAAFQIPLGMGLMLVSLHCQLTFAQTRSSLALVGAVLAAILSIGAYEIFAPLLAGFAVALALGGWWNARPGASVPSHARISLLAILAVVVLAILYKIAFSGRTGDLGDPNRYLLGLKQLIRLDYDWRLDSSLNFIAMARAYFWAPVEGLWQGILALAELRSGILVAAIVFVIAAISWWRLSPRKSPEQQVEPQRLLLIGIVVFFLGHATFLIVPSITFSSTGIGNRTHVAAAMGVAMILVSVIFFAAWALARLQSGKAFALIVAVVAGLMFARMSEIERHWAEAPLLQEQVLSAARTDLRHLPANSVVILDGVCPYHGPAIVFESGWDVGGALTLVLGRPMSGDAVSPRMTVTANGLETSIYKQLSIYPYGGSLYVYNPYRHLLVRLEDFGAAANYFRTRQPTKCPIGFVARGVEV